MSRILIAEDDRAIREGVADALELAGYETVTAEDGRKALEAFQSGHFDLLLLDVMMPEIDGFELCRRIRRGDSKTAIIMLTAKSEEIDKVLGLESGADDYVTKPFGIRELLARISAVLRRSGPQPESAGEAGAKFEFDGWEIFPAELCARRGGRSVALTLRECDLLRFFVEQPNIVLTRERIMKKVWHSAAASSRTLDQHIAVLRKKLDAGAALVSVYGAGYRYVPQCGGDSRCG